MGEVVDFVQVSTAGLETSPVVDASEGSETVEWVQRILRAATRPGSVPEN